MDPPIVLRGAEIYVCDFCKGELKLCRGCGRAVHGYELTADGSGCWRCAELTDAQRADFARTIIAEYTGHEDAPRTEDVTA